ncbi:MAG: hypothetical protein FJ271_05885 [Planctomycetes bacterium]|nr:hypothetical protein [Planctomycetota bacterium]
MLILVGIVFSVSIAGCTKGPAKGVGMDGKVTYQGKPVPGGRITFHPKDGGPAYTAEIQYDGTFAAKDVPALGAVIVTVDNSFLKGAEGPIGDPTVEAKAKGENIKVDPKMLQQKENVKVDTSKARKYIELPAKYAKKESSDLTWDIKAGNAPTTIELK